MPSFEEKTLFATLIDGRARETPNRTYAIIPKSDELQDGFEDFTYQQLARAIDKVSWWLDGILGKSRDFDTFAYMGASDLRYLFLYIAAMKTGRQVLFPLFMNSREAQLRLLRETKCKALIASNELLRHWHALSPDVDNLEILSMPSFSDLVKDDSVQPYHFTKSWDDSKHDPLLICHTSGSTGLPNPVRYTSNMFSVANLDSPGTIFSNLKVIVPMPPSWILGLAFYIHIPLEFDTVPVLIPTNAPHPMTPEYMDKVHTSVRADAGIYVPSLLKELSRNPAYIDHMRHLSVIAYGGAPLEREVGDLLTSFCHLQTIMGSTEAGAYGIKPPPTPEDWMYYNFDPETGLRFLHYQDDLYESVIVRHTEPEKAGTQTIFYTFPELDVFHTKDVWREHPTKKGLWLMCGRTDDFVKLRTLTKFNATHVEGIILKDPRVKAVVMGGEGRGVPFLLVELATVETDAVKALEAIWPVIEAANAKISSEIRLRQEMVLFSTPGKPLKGVVGKGTTNRRATIEDYAVEVEALYERNAVQ